MLTTLKTVLEGKKTYILAGLGILYVVGAWLGLWELNQQVVDGLGLGALVALRSAL